MPFTVITLKRSTPSLRGDLTKWMQEIATGVYIGNFNTRVREKLWSRVIETVGDGEATMSFAYRNEIGYQFVTWNTRRENIDCDGIPLVLLPVEQAGQNESKKVSLGFSNAAKFRNARKFSGVKPAAKKSTLPYVVLDIETDGLDENVNTIIELGAIRVDGENSSEFHRLIRYEQRLPESITELTGITENMLMEEGVFLDDALNDLLNFIGDDILVGYRVDFDIQFINKALEKFNRPKLTNLRHDLMRYVKKEKMFLKDYKLKTALAAYGIIEEVPHRALKDARLIARLASKVNKFRDFVAKK